MTNGNERPSQLLKIIHTNPGINFRGLMERTGMKNGVLSYHVKKFEKRGVIQVNRGPGQTRFFPLDISEYEQKVATALRKETPRRIILFLMAEKQSEFSRIPDGIGRSPSTTSINLAQLVDRGIVSTIIENRKKLYFVKNVELIDEFIDEYHPEIISQAVDSFADTFSAL